MLFYDMVGTDPIFENILMQVRETVWMTWKVLSCIAAAALHYMDLSSQNWWEKTGFGLLDTILEAINLIFSTKSGRVHKRPPSD